MAACQECNGWHEMNDGPATVGQDERSEARLNGTINDW